MPIPGTTKRSRLAENLAAAALEFTAGDLSAIDAATTAITVFGARYPEHLERMAGH